MEIKSDPELISNLMISFQDHFLKSMSESTKERFCKDGLRQEMKEIVKCLNEIYSDVKFEYHWYRGSPAQYFKKDQLCVRGFNQLLVSDENEWGDLEEQEEQLYEVDLAEIGIVLFYHWHQKCSLGHTHRTTRFYYYSAPKLVEIVGFHLLKPDYKEFTKRYVPNFFY